MVSARVLLATLAVTGSALSQAPFKIVNSFASPHGADYTHGLAYRNGLLWIAAGLGTGAGTIYQVDAYTGATLTSFQAPATGLRGMTHDGATLWVANWHNNTVYQLNDTTGQLLNSFQAFVGTGRPDGLAWDGAFLLISDETNQIHWFTPSGTQVRTISVPAIGSFNPRDLGWDGTTVWAGYQSAAKIRQHDPITGAVLTDIPAPSGSFQQGLEWADWYLWSTGGANASVYQIDIGPPYVELVGTMSHPNTISFKVTDAQAQQGQIALVALSLSGVAGFQLGSVTIPLSLDAMTEFSVVNAPVFSAVVDASGVAQTPTITVPPLPIGIPFWAAAVTLSATNITSVADPIRFVTQ